MKQSVTRLSRDEDLYLQIAKGEIPGHAGEHKFGASDINATGVQATLWPEGGIYAWPSAATAMNVSSSDADDTIAGAGARTVTVYGLDANYDLVQETVDMDGQDASATTTEFLRIYRMTVDTAGASDENEGIVYAGTGAPVAGKPGTAVYGLISAGQNQSEIGYYTVPNNKTAFLTSFYVGIDAGAQNRAVLSELYVREVSGLFRVKFSLQGATGDTQHIFRTPLRYSEKTDLDFRITTDQNNASVRGGFEMVLIDD